MDSFAKVAAWIADRQGLLASTPDVQSQLMKSGWTRSVGGANPYLAAFSRGTTSREKIDAELDHLDIHELPSARGCVYLIPREHFGIALACAQGHADAAAMRTATNKLGVTREEIDRLGEKVLNVLEAGPLDPRAIKEQLGDAVRNFGEAGKKVGQTTDLPLAIQFLQTSGQVRRVPLNGRLDNERYAYALWADSPAIPSKEEALAIIAPVYFDWTGISTLKEFSAFFGCSQKAASLALTNADIEPVEPGNELLIRASSRTSLESFQYPEQPDYRLLGSLDNLVHLRRTTAFCLSDADKNHPLFSGQQEPNGLVELDSHLITDRGRIVGMWKYDLDNNEIAWATFEKPSTELQRAVESTQEFIREQLGDAQSFSLDSMKTRRPIIAHIRACQTT